MKNLTMKKIAELANVSQPTVSRVINNNPSVNPEMKERVLAVIKKYDFVPNKTAQALKRNQSYLIGVNLPEINNPYYTELLDELELKAKKQGYNLILHSSRYNNDMELRNIDNFLARQIDGLIYVPSIDSFNETILEYNVPTVALARIVDNCTSVAISDEYAGKLVANHLLDEGHREFCYIGFYDDTKFIGFKNTLEKNNLYFNDDHFIEIDSLKINTNDIQQRIDSKLVTSNYSAIFCANDTIAFELQKVLSKRNIKIPEEIAIVGFDDTYLAKSAEITSVYQPLEEIASLGFDKLVEAIKGNLEVEKIYVNPVLKVRNSSKKRT